MSAIGKGAAALASGAVAAYLGYVLLFQVFPSMFASLGPQSMQMLSSLQLTFSIAAFASLLALGTVMQYWSTAYLVGYVLAAILFLGTGLVDLTEVVVTSAFAIVVLFHRFGGG